MAIEFVREIPLAWRRLRASPGFLLTVVLTLAAGTGLSTAVYSVLDPLLVQSLPVREPGQLVVLKSTGSVETSDMWWPDAMERFRRVDAVLAGTIAFSDASAEPVSVAGVSRTAWVASVSDSFFQVLGLGPRIGRLFGPDDGGEPAVVIGHEYWRREWNTDPGVVGRIVAIRGVPHVVRGVAPQGFRGLIVGSEPDMYVALRAGNTTRWMHVVARLHPGVTIAQARAALEAPFRAAVASSGIPEVEHPQVLAELLVEPAGRGLSPLRDRYGLVAWMLMGMVTLVLLVACTNVSSLMVSRAVQRRHEFAIRRALGASRTTLLSSMTGEAAIVAILGGGVGLVLASVAGPILVRALATGVPHMTLDATLDTRVFGFALVAAVLAVIISGLLPGLISARTSPAESLGSQRHIAAHPARSTWALVVIQIGLSASLISGAVLLGRSVWNLLAHDVGFDASRVLAVSIAMEPPAEAGVALGTVVVDLVDRLSAIPGVEAVSYGGVTPISGRVIGVNLRRGDVPDAESTYTLLTPIAPGYFATLGIRQVSGRDFARADVDGEPVAIVNQTLATRLFGASPAVGRRVRFVEGTRPPMTVIGVVGDSTFGSVREAAQSVLYSPAHLMGARLPAATLVVRSRDEHPERLAAILERVIRLSAPNVGITELRTFRSRIGESVQAERIAAVLLAGFGATALAVTGIGLFGVLSMLLARRTREIGVRIALGATRGRIGGFVLRPVAGALLAGAVVGVTGAAIIGRLVASLLYEVGSLDTATLVVAAVVLVTSVAMACAIPLRRAVRVDPAALLREN